MIAAPSDLLRVPLGRTGLTVSRLSFGTGTSGRDCESVQSAQDPEALARLLVRGWELGFRVWDTSDNYGTHPHVRAALARVPRDQVAVLTKTYAQTAAEARESLARSLEQLGTPHVDLCLLHEVDDPEELEAAEAAVAALHDAKARGLVRAVGLSTHAILTLEAVVGDPRIDVILTNYNLAEDHMDAGRRDYEAALRAAASHGQGILVMKTLGEGRLAHRVQEAVRHNLAQPFVDVVTVGLSSAAEVEEVGAIAAAWHADEGAAWTAAARALREGPPLPRPAPDLV